MKAFVLMLLKKMASDVLLSIAETIIATLKDRDDNTVNKDAITIIDMLKRNYKYSEK